MHVGRVGMISRASATVSLSVVAFAVSAVGAHAVPPPPPSGMAPGAGQPPPDTLTVAPPSTVQPSPAATPPPASFARLTGARWSPSRPQAVLLRFTCNARFRVVLRPRVGAAAARRLGCWHGSENRVFTLNRRAARAAVRKGMLRARLVVTVPGVRRSTRTLRLRGGRAAGAPAVHQTAQQVPQFWNGSQIWMECPDIYDASDATSVVIHANWHVPEPGDPWIAAWRVWMQVWWPEVGWRWLLPPDDDNWFWGRMDHQGLLAFRRVTPTLIGEPVVEQFTWWWNQPFGVHGGIYVRAFAELWVGVGQGNWVHQYRQVQTTVATPTMPATCQI